MRAAPKPSNDRAPGEGRWPTAVAMGFAACIGLDSGGSASALDCRHSKTVAERTTCGDSKLLAADQELNSTYFQLLRSISDPQEHRFLVNSQRRWLQARDEFLHDFGNWPRPERDNIVSSLTVRTFLLTSAQERKSQISQRNKQNELIVLAGIKRARRDEAAYSAGPYTGYWSSCFFAPPGFGNGAYVCVGWRGIQNGDRVCLSQTDWASNHETEYKVVARVGDAGLRQIATCSYGYGTNEPECPDLEAHNPATELGWDRKQVELQLPERGSHEKFHRYDPEAEVGDDFGPLWWDRCLTDPTYPPETPKDAEPLPSKENSPPKQP